MGLTSPNGRSAGSSPTWSTLMAPGWPVASVGLATCSIDTWTPISSAARRIRGTSPIRTGRQSASTSGWTSALAQISGPTPAGSPMVTATTGRGARWSGEVTAGVLLWARWVRCGQVEQSAWSAVAARFGEDRPSVAGDQAGDGVAGPGNGAQVGEVEPVQHGACGVPAAEVERHLG